MSNWTQPFGTFVYSPDIAVYVSGENGVIDLTPDVVSAQTNRRTSKASNLSLVLNNKHKKWDGVLHRMDKVTVFMKRTSWLQVFSGYLVSVPYITVVPGTVAVEAECTIRRLTYTFWDPHATENITSFWPIAASTSPDSASGATMFKMLTAVAGWDPDRIWVQEIPSGFLEQVAAVAQKASDDWAATDNAMLVQILGQYLGGGYTPGTTAAVGTGANSQQAPLSGSANLVKVLPYARKWYDATDANTFGQPRGWPEPHMHAGVDVIMDEGEPLYACATGYVKLASNAWGGPNAFQLYDLTGNHFYYAHASRLTWSSQQKDVVAGELVGYAGKLGDTSVPHLHFEVHPGNGDAVNPGPYLAAAYDGYTTVGGRAMSVDQQRAMDGALGLPDTASPSSGTVAGGGIAAGGPFSFGFITPSSDLESAAFTGDRAWLNDTSLQDSINAVCNASLRSYQSAPNGDFVAWFPDKYGLYGKTPSLQIRDIEIVDFKVNISDRDLRTHVGVSGTRVPQEGSVTIYDWLQTIGIVSVTNTAIMKILLGLDSEKSYFDLDGRWILERFGIRPYKEEVAEIHDPVWELLLAYNRFQDFWTKQFLATVTFTFMPELYPGMRVELADQGLAFYVEEVSHRTDRQNGFTTDASISCPMLKGPDGTFSLIPIERMPQEIPFDQAENIIAGDALRRTHVTPNLNLEDLQ